MSDPRTFSLSQRQWDLLEEQLELKSICEFLQEHDDEHGTEEQPEQERMRKRRSLFGRLKCEVVSDVKKQKSLHNIVVTKQPELATSLFSESNDNTENFAGDLDKEHTGRKDANTEDTGLQIGDMPTADSNKTSEVLSIPDVSRNSPITHFEDLDQIAFHLDPSGHSPQPSDQKLQAFYKMMVGNRQGRRQDDSLLVVEINPFSADILLASHEACGGSGLAIEIEPYMVDLLKRQQSLDALSSLKELYSSSEKLHIARKLPSHYFSYEHRDLFIALLEITPNHSHSRLMNLCTQLNRPVPMLYRRVLDNGNIGLQLATSGYADLLCHPTDPLLVSYGTTSMIGKGKTRLLAELFGFNDQSNSWTLESSPGGPCHHLSIDMVFNAVISTDNTAQSFILADAHGYSSSSQGFNLVLACLSNAAAYTYLHVCAEDFSSDGVPNEELRFMLKLCAEFAKRRSYVLLLWRDYCDKHAQLLSAAEDAVVSAVSGSTIDVRIYKVENLADMNEVELQFLTEDLKKSLMESQKSMEQGTFPVMESVKSLMYTLSTASRSSLSSMIDDTAIPIATERDLDLPSLGTKIHECLEQKFLQANDGNSILTQCLFPALTIVQRIAKIEESLRKCPSEGGRQNQAFIAEKEAQLTAEKRKKRQCKTSDIVKQFAVVVATGDTAAIEEFSRQLEAWKQPKCKPLLQKRRELHDEYERTIADLSETTKQAFYDGSLDSIKNQIRANARSLDACDMSIDDFWSELIALTEVAAEDEHGRSMTLLERECGLSGSQLCTAYTHCVMRGYPMQLLRGHPLYMPSEFMSEVLRTIQVESSRQLFVISVIGAQSSAKSTLLNYLFGCGFATRAGKCTKGLYASYMRTRDLDLLVLDSEGLMSVESGGRDFDNQVTLMAMACSHIVIINHKGELSRHLQELLEVALYAMHYLEVTRWRPDVLFALRDQVEREYEAIRGQLLSMRQNLDESTSKFKGNVKKLLKIHADSLFLLPPAFANEIYCGRETKLPTVLFSNGVLSLRKKIFNAYHARVARQDDLIDDLLSLEQWLIHARSVWTTITTFGGNFLEFESLQQVEQRQEVVIKYKKVAEEILESNDGFKKQCQDVLHSFNTRFHIQDLSRLEVSDQFHAELDTVTKSAKRKARQCFSDALKNRPYGARWKPEFDAKLDAVIEEERMVFLRIWRRRVNTARDEVRIAEIEKSLVHQMDTLLQEKGNMKAMEPSELQKEFDALWDNHVKTARRQLEDSRHTPEVQEVIVVSRFYDEITASEFEDDIFRVLKQDVRHISPATDLMTTQEPKKYFDYFKHSNTRKVKHREDNEEIKKSKKLKAAKYLKQQMSEFFQTLREDFQQEYDDEIQGTVLKSVLNQANVKVSEVGRQMKLQFDVSLQMASFANAVYDCLRYEVLLALERKQNLEVDNKLTELKSHKEQIEQRAMARLRGQHDDIARAQSVVDDVYGCLKVWAMNETLDLSLKVQQEIKKRFPDARTAALRAYEACFEGEDWEAVVEYSINANKYLKQLIKQQFQRLETLCISKDLPRIRVYMSEKLKALKIVFLKWADQEERETKTKSFVQFAKKENELAQVAKKEEKISARFPVYELDVLSVIPTDVQVIDPKDFAKTFESAMDNKVKASKLDETVEKLLQNDLENARQDLWEKVKGCQKVCPICNSKCDRDEGHLRQGHKHRCHIHLLPAFHGSRSTVDETPILDCCTSGNIREINWRSKDDPKKVMRPFEQHVAHNYPDWQIPHLKRVEKEARLQRAWVNCRKRLVRHYNMKDKIPEEWIELYQQENALT
jgi:hypothetical protein